MYHLRTPGEIVAFESHHALLPRPHVCISEIIRALISARISPAPPESFAYVVYEGILYLLWRLLHVVHVLWHSLYVRSVRTVRYL